MNSFTCIYFNARGLKSKIDVLEYKLSCLTDFPEAICITETWISDVIVLNGTVWDKFVIYRKNRNNFGGGVAILIKQEFNVEACNNDLSAVEGLACKFTLGKHEVVICCIYRPPNVLQILIWQ